MILQPTLESNGPARRRRPQGTKAVRRRSSETDLSLPDLSVISVPATLIEEEPSEMMTANNNNGGDNDGGTSKKNDHSDDTTNGGSSLERSSSGNNYLDMLLQSASTAMGLTPVHSNGSSNGNAVYAPIKRISQAQAQGPQLVNRPRRVSSSARRRNSFTSPQLSSTSPPSYYTNLHDPTTNNNRDSFELKQKAIQSLQSDGTLEQLSALENFQSEERYNATQNIWRRLAIRSSHPDVTQKELIQRSTFLVISSLTVGAGTLWGGMYVILGEWGAACMPFLYSTCMSLVLVTFICGGDGGVVGRMVNSSSAKYINGHRGRFVSFRSEPAIVLRPVQVSRLRQQSHPPQSSVRGVRVTSPQQSYRPGRVA